jgi:hypothetical protein
LAELFGSHDSVSGAAVVVVGWFFLSYVVAEAKNRIDFLPLG